MTDSEWYLNFIKDEIQQLKDGNFTGNVEFKPNFKNGSICNMNVTLHKSVKQSEE
jgi:hypothetical protein